MMSDSGGRSCVARASNTAANRRTGSVDRSAVRSVRCPGTAGNDRPGHDFSYLAHILDDFFKPFERGEPVVQRFTVIFHSE